MVGRVIARCALCFALAARFSSADEVDPFGAREGDSVALGDDADAAGVAPVRQGPSPQESLKAVASQVKGRRTHPENDVTKNLGLHIMTPELATQFPVIMSCMLDYLGNAVFIFNDLFGAQDFEDSITEVSDAGVFTCIFDDDETGAKVTAKRIHSEHVTFAKCVVPEGLREKDSLRVSLTRKGGLSFQDEAAWPSLLLSKTPLPEKTTLVGCVSFSYSYNGLPALHAWLAFHQLMGFDHVFLYDTGPRMTDTWCVSICVRWYACNQTAVSELCGVHLMSAGCETWRKRSSRSAKPGLRRACHGSSTSTSHFPWPARTKTRCTKTASTACAGKQSSSPTLTWTSSFSHWASSPRCRKCCSTRRRCTRIWRR
jgi:hypothetical protein